jgi:hypothetical protein
MPTIDEIAQEIGLSQGIRTGLRAQGFIEAYDFACLADKEYLENSDAKSLKLLRLVLGNPQHTPGAGN